MSDDEGLGSDEGTESDSNPRRGGRESLRRDENKWTTSRRREQGVKQHRPRRLQEAGWSLCVAGWTKRMDHLDSQTVTHRNTERRPTSDHGSRRTDMIWHGRHQHEHGKGSGRDQQQGHGCTRTIWGPPPVVRLPLLLAIVKPTHTPRDQRSLQWRPRYIIRRRAAPRGGTSLIAGRVRTLTASRGIRKLQIPSTSRG